MPAISIVWHPDLDRVGEVSPLTDFPCQVSRLAPLFFRASNPSYERPLGETRISRTPVVEVSRPSEFGLEVRPGDTPLEVELEGLPLHEPRSVSWDQLRPGLILTIGRQHALCLHTVRLPLARGPALGIVGESDRIENVRRMIQRLADLDVPVLIRGETGTGKDLVARALAAASPRAGRPFVALNMAEIPATTAAAQLFGHEKGAFTGATADRAGYFVEAHGGTFFLDEIGLASAEVRAMLLRVLETGEIRPLGSKSGRKVDVRIIAATDAQLERAIALGQFSEPLFTRLAGFQVELPALRERRQDFGPLLLHFLRAELAKTGDLHRLDTVTKETRPWLPASVVAALARAPWTGNVRALRNIVRQIAISSRGSDQAQIDPIVQRVLDGDASSPSPVLTAAAAAEPAPPAYNATKRRTPRRDGLPTEDEIDEALRQNHWEPGATANALGISRNTLYKLMEESPRFRTASSIPKGEFLAAFRRCGGNVDRMSEHLRISRRAIQLRLKAIEKEDGEDEDK